MKYKFLQLFTVSDIPTIPAHDVPTFQKAFTKLLCSILASKYTACFGHNVQNVLL